MSMSRSSNCVGREPSHLLVLERRQWQEHIVQRKRMRRNFVVLIQSSCNSLYVRLCTFWILFLWACTCRSIMLCTCKIILMCPC
uniref:Predicted protein n=1 Tax=Hordeum vulgare subsp. vulgare TaxID=112509 RepID=F2EEW9_HORVV|nr:predicted protein [Hordeum vulgare subsp. vulgare]